MFYEHFKEFRRGDEFRGGHHSRQERFCGNFGGFGHGRHGFRGRWRGEGRMFGAGDLRYVIPQLISEKPSYGYEIIKAIEERLSGGYAPSPGVVYPTLTLLEEEGLAEVASQDGNKKLYAATASGREYLKTNQATIEAILGRMREANRRFGRGRHPQIMRAMMNLGLAMKIRVERGTLTAEQVSKIAAAIDAAARTIDEV